MSEVLSWKYLLILLQFLNVSEGALQNASHCWDFANAEGDIEDNCGSMPLTANGKKMH